MMTSDVLTWHAVLRGVSVLNLLAWLAAAVWLTLRRGQLSPEERALRRLQLGLSAIYVAGCAYRSFWPVFDIPRLVVVDSAWSSVALGRSVATCAELAFVAQWALMLHAASRVTHSALGRRLAWLLVPLIVVAETCSWYSVLTTSNLGHVVEESLWGLAAALLVASLVAIWPRCTPAARRLLALWCLTAVSYVVYMFGVDVPMYLGRWLADEAQGRPYLSVAQGLVDVAGRWTVSHRWADWSSEVGWMTLYFSAAVWLSIALVHLPVPRLRAGLSRA